ncbi:MAG: hypothetical protein HWN81_11975 [Candidatus Lokiarchaeota archaeon]|nr:hypothetical protein [Candidatus Lokiarchaeota archaeon]
MNITQIFLEIKREYPFSWKESILKASAILEIAGENKLITDKERFSILLKRKKKRRIMSLIDILLYIGGVGSFFFLNKDFFI